MAQLCPQCQGRGFLTEPCPGCNGQGRQMYSTVVGFEQGARTVQDYFLCTVCFGKRERVRYGHCPTCAGLGQVRYEMRVIACPYCNGHGQVWKNVGHYPSGALKQLACVCPNCQGQRQVQSLVAVPDYA